MNKTIEPTDAHINATADRKNVQVIDGALNCTYDTFSVSNADFKLIFPSPGQDVEFSEDFFKRLGKKAAQPVWDRIWKHRVDKKTVNGIHGTLFCDLQAKKKYYPTKRDSEMVTGIDSDDD